MPKSKLVFRLRPVDAGDMGVFATADIPKGTYLPLFREGDYHLYQHKTIEHMPDWEYFASFCVRDSFGYHGPKDFNQMSVGWYIRHADSPTAVHRNYRYYAVRDIKAGEEVTVDHHTLEDDRW
ncbi:MAG: hypothetical protein A3C84_05060 [Candidatus Ryanbacteria bacterium RIFCSPHIGHO2_02_FULL_48_12]|uniref:SET domain-containing protein n=1 Tax=Candidatus Ryanbacteria bacterium RIFCSPHIGHO2_01_FULL_48_27 TaxID=1802115 RepID=A0A1G2G844_9BACT|nr:MAG: hypothetical protein A2756_06065 [Candidatus Ryanbacteria bacterium RIFCSPHIGHO2_01_FULL_48_27]OGZ49531.1 MAG: hypothetical protein A3C84_05060 [Candidatus Ryanbacteria bacterium RIFCSPHIGHO2_02_FULL_48_12]